MRIRILCHNVFWFQGVPFAADRPKGPNRTVLASLVERYRAVEPDVVCLQEIQSEEAFRLVARALSMAGDYCPGVALAQYGGAVLRREGKRVADARSVSGIISQRMWQMVDVPSGAGGSLRLCNVHLPSGRQVGKDAASLLRREELSVVLSHAKPPHLILGDFNEQPGGPLSEYLSERGYHDAALLADRPAQPTALGGGRGDYIWVHETVLDAVAEYCVMPRESLATAIPGKTFLSDHLPLWIALAADRLKK